jgi:hypothetical protein
VGFILPEISASNIQLQILSTSGKLITSKNFSRINGELVYQMDISGLPDGMYLVKLFTAQKQAIKKLLILR